jgi:hypothetical protein
MMDRRFPNKPALSADFANICRILPVSALSALPAHNCTIFLFLQFFTVSAWQIL